MKTVYFFKVQKCDKIELDYYKSLYGVIILAEKYQKSPRNCSFSASIHLTAEKKKITKFYPETAKTSLSLLSSLDIVRSLPVVAYFFFFFVFCFLFYLLIGGF
jgi:hypothetical protein